MLQQKKNDSSHLVTSAVEGMLLVKQPNSPSTPPPTLLRFKSNGRDRSLSPGTLEQIFYAPPNEVDGRISRGVYRFLFQFQHRSMQQNYHTSSGKE